jgi:thiamine-monophosphate kinase
VGETVGSLGEFGLIDAVTARLPSGADVIVGPGDDAAVVSFADGRTVASTDVLVEGRHFRRDWSSALDVGHKAAAASLADVAAMGARATALLVGLGIPPDLPAQWALDLADGIREECELVGAVVVGGDVVRSERIVVSVTALGTLDGREPVLRSGAVVGDIVALAGRLGHAAAGLSVLSRGFRSPRKLVDAHRRPVPPYDAGPLAAQGGATSMIDVSDGLVADLTHVAVASGVVVLIESALLPVGDPLIDAAAAFTLDPLTWVLTGGEDHALAATFAADATLPAGFVRIGSVIDRGDQDATVLVDGRPHVGSGGHDHFR